MNGPSIIIRGIGSYVPQKVLTNEDLSKILDTSDEWIRTRSGISQRHIAGPAQTTSDLGLEASKRALAHAGITAQQIDLIIVATATPDQPCPATACILQAKLGLENIPAFDVAAVCSGFIYALDVAKAMMLSGNYCNVLVVGAEKFSSILDWQDRSTCVLFGDGAGAVVLQKIQTPSVGLLATKLGALGREAGILEIPAGGATKPASIETVQSREHFIKMQGREVYKNAVRITSSVCLDVLADQKICAQQLACIVPHQANIRIIESMANQMHVPVEKFFVNLDKYGNTSAASIPIALDEAFHAKRWHPGDLILLAAFGAGLTWGAALLRWH